MKVRPTRYCIQCDETCTTLNAKETRCLSCRMEKAAMDKKEAVTNLELIVELHSDTPAGGLAYSALKALKGEQHAQEILRKAFSVDPIGDDKEQR